MIKVEGKGGISAKIIADSVSSVTGKRITTFELEYPRFIHAEFMTHRMFSRNAASSRAIPVEKVIEQVEKNPAMPIHWGKNQKGMQAKEEVIDGFKEFVKQDWEASSIAACDTAKWLVKYEVHKQIVNRILEPYQFIKVVCTATEFENFFWLRSHEDAQPEIKELSDCMYKSREQSTPQKLQPGEWHVPYVDNFRTSTGKLTYYVDSNVGDWYLTLEQALKVSASCCAQVSYRLLDNSIEKAEKIYDMLVKSKPVHASPFEHQASPIEEPEFKSTEDIWEDGVTHMDEDYKFWSGNFCGFIQHRQLIKDNVKHG